MKLLLSILLMSAVCLNAQTKKYHWESNKISLEIPDFMVLEEGEDDTPVFISPGLKLFLYDTEMPYNVPEDDYEWQLITSFYFELEDIEKLDLKTHIEVFCLSGLSGDDRAIVCYFQGPVDKKLCFVYLEFDEDDGNKELLARDIVSSMSQY